jgi:hypothetical protein
MRSERTRTVKGRWYSTDWCKECNSRFCGSDLAYSGGVCPYCGHNSNSTMCDWKTRSFRKVKHQRRVLGLFWWTVEREYEEKTDDGRAVRGDKQFEEGRE